MGLAGVCTSCLISKYQPSEGSTSCLDCPAGQFTNATGSALLAGCTGCAAGEYLEAGVCTSCPASKYQPAPASTLCLDCPAGQSTTGAGTALLSGCSSPTAYPTTAYPTAVPTTAPTALPTPVPTATSTAFPTALPTAARSTYRVPDAVPDAEPELDCRTSFCADSRCRLDYGHRVQQVHFHAGNSVCLPPHRRSACQHDG